MQGPDAGPAVVLDDSAEPRYPDPVPSPATTEPLPGGVVHDLPPDLEAELAANATALEAWKDITPLARNEFICWVEDAASAPGGRGRTSSH